MKKLINYISCIEDTRGGFNLKHKLIDITIITILAIMNGVTTWDGIALFGRMREKWLRVFGIAKWNPLTCHLQQSVFSD